MSLQPTLFDWQAVMGKCSTEVPQQGVSDNLNMFPVCNYLVLFPSQPGSAVHLALVREAANFKLKYGRKKEAISDLEQLWKWVTVLKKYSSSSICVIWLVLAWKRTQCAPWRLSHSCWFYFLFSRAASLMSSSSQIYHVLKQFDKHHYNVLIEQKKHTL